MTRPTIDFDLLPWHDAVLLGININRRNPGANDEVSVTVRWSGSSSATLNFMSCYAFESRMNFGIIAAESILEARCVRNSDEVVGLQQKWAKIGIDLSGLQCFEIVTSSTASIIRIYALSFECDA